MDRQASRMVELIELKHQAKLRDILVRCLDEGLSQQQIALRLGVSEGTVSNWFKMYGFKRIWVAPSAQ